MNYLLKGNFVECCDCFTICPCWVNDLPDEDHCSGLYVWSFGPRSQIDGVNVAGMHVAAASFHAVRAGGQAMFFIDATKAGPQQMKQVEHLLYDAFSNQHGGGGFAALSRLLGVYLGYREAKITSKFQNGSFNVEVAISTAAGMQSIAKTSGSNKVLSGNAAPMTLASTGLSEQLGIQGKVIVQQMGDLTVDVAALPGGPLNFRGRSGMRTKFSYKYSATRR